MLLAVVGLSVVLARHPAALTAVRVVGGLYLLYLGGRLVRSTFVSGETRGDHEVDRTGSAFRQGFLTNVTNPKAVLGVVDAVVGFLPWAVVVAVGTRLSTLLSRRRVRGWWDRTIGAALGGLGSTLLVKGS